MDTDAIKVTLGATSSIYLGVDAFRCLTQVAEYPHKVSLYTGEGELLIVGAALGEGDLLLGGRDFLVNVSSRTICATRTIREMGIPEGEHKCTTFRNRVHVKFTKNRIDDEVDGAMDRLYRYHLAIGLIRQGETVEEMEKTKDQLRQVLCDFLKEQQ